MKISFITMEMKDGSFIKQILGCLIVCLIACGLLFYRSRPTDDSVRPSIGDSPELPKSEGAQPKRNMKLEFEKAQRSPYNKQST